MRREKEPQRRDRKDDDGGERCVQASVASADEPPDEEEERREKQVEPFLDRQAPGDRIEVDSIGRAKQVFDIEQVTQEIGGQQIAGHQRDDNEGDDVGRDRTHPAAGQKNPEVAPGLSDHPVDDLRREHKAAENEKHLDAGDRDGVRGGAERGVGCQIMRNRYCEGRRAPQEVERRTALHAGGV